MQLHASAPVKQRAAREKRIVRSMLQDAQDTLFQSLAVVAQSGLDHTLPHLVQLHCLTAVQDTLPLATPNPAASDAPPGFAPKVTDAPPAQSSLLTHMWPFSESQCASWGMNPDHWAAQDPKPMLQLLRVHQQLKDKQQDSTCQRLRLAAMHSASASGNHKLASRLLADVQALSEEGDISWCASRLLDTQRALSGGDLDTATAYQQLEQILQALHNSSASNRQHPQFTSIQLQVMLQLAKWSGSTTSSASAVTDWNVSHMLHQPSVTPLDPSLWEDIQAVDQAHDQEPYLSSAVCNVPRSAAAWLAYADCIHTCSVTSLRDNMVKDAVYVDCDSGISRCFDAVQAYCRHLALASQTMGPAGKPEDCTAALLKVLHLVTTSAVSPSEVGLSAMTECLQGLPPLTWRPVVPQLFALLAHDNAALSGLAESLLHHLGSIDAAAVLYPALVESKRIEQGMPQFSSFSQSHASVRFHSLLYKEYCTAEACIVLLLHVYLGLTMCICLLLTATCYSAYLNGDQLCPLASLICALLSQVWIHPSLPHCDPVQQIICSSIICASLSATWLRPHHQCQPGLARITFPFLVCRPFCCEARLDGSDIQLSGKAA